MYSTRFLAVHTWCALACSALLCACQEPTPSHFFGYWDEPVDGGVRPDSARPMDAATPLDAAALVCSPSEIGGEDKSSPARALGTASRSHKHSTQRTTDDDDDDDDDEHVIADSRCASGYRWIGGKEESQLMMPGSDCLSCHQPSMRSARSRLTDSDEPDGYVVAGTVYAAEHEPSDCLGVEGVLIRITDARGQVIERVSNRAGNFYIKSSKYRLSLPFTAVISAKGRTRKMEHAECLTSCNTCHTASGMSGAPGRILLP